MTPRISKKFDNPLSGPPALKRFHRLLIRPVLTAFKEERDEST